MSDVERAKRSHKPLPLVVVLVSPDDERAAVLQAMRGSAELIFCGLVAEAEHLLLARHPAAFLTHPRDEEGTSVRDFTARLSFAHPDLPIVILSNSPERSRGEARAERWPGVAGAVRKDNRLGQRVLAHVVRVEHRMRRRVMGAALAEDLPLSAKDVVRRAIEDGDRPQSVVDLANAIGVPRKTMDRRLSKAIPLTARQLIGWGRLLAAAMQLEESTSPVDVIAYELEFSSPSALRNLLQRYAALTPTELRQRGGSAFLLTSLTRALRAPRAD